MSTFVTNSRAEELAAELRSMIVRGAWEIGSRLPTTRQLATEHGVSLSTVQSALRELEMQGVVERQGRRGACVKRRHPLQPANPVVATRQIAVVLVRWRNDFSDSWSHEAIIETQQSIAAAGFHALPLFVDPYQGDALEQLQQQLHTALHALAGVILINSPLLNNVPGWLDEWDIPWVYLNQPDRRATENFVGIDYLAAFGLGQCLARMELDHLLALGLNPAGSPTGVAKLTELVRGYVAASGRTPVLEYWSRPNDPDRSERFGYLCDTLKKPQRPSVIFASSDAGALQAMRACRQLGLAVPEDVRIVGGSGVSFSAHTSPPLTVVGQTADEAARVAIEMLEGMMGSGHRRLSARSVPARLIVRESLSIPEDVIDELPPDVRSLVDSSLTEHIRQ